MESVFVSYPDVAWAVVPSAAWAPSVLVEEAVPATLTLIDDDVVDKVVVLVMEAPAEIVFDNAVVLVVVVVVFWSTPVS